jgi:hypothetical protein
MQTLPGGWRTVPEFLAPALAMACLVLQRAGCASIARVGVAVTVAMLSIKHVPFCTAMSRRRNGQGPMLTTAAHDLRRDRDRGAEPFTLPGCFQDAIATLGAGSCCVPLPDGAARAPYAMPRCDTGYCPPRRSGPLPGPSLSVA